MFNDGTDLPGLLLYLGADSLLERSKYVFKRGNLLADLRAFLILTGERFLNSLKGLTKLKLLLVKQDGIRMARALFSCMIVLVQPLHLLYERFDLRGEVDLDTLQLLLPLSLLATQPLNGALDLLRLLADLLGQNLVLLLLDLERLVDRLGLCRQALIPGLDLLLQVCRLVCKRRLRFFRQLPDQVLYSLDQF